MIPKPRAVWRLELRTTRDAEEAASELLEQVFQRPASSYTELKTGRTVVAVYLAQKAEWDARRAKAVGAGADRIRQVGLAPATPTVRLSRLPARDWAGAWKRHFKPMEVGGVLLVKPSWSRKRPKRGQVVVVLDPGLSFGTGQHPTTAFCLRELVRRRRPAAQQSLLDIGTGSGILAIAAAGLGYSPVDALDNDPQALVVARANACVNGAGGQIRFSQADITRLAARPRRTYSVVCANLVSSLLLECREQIQARLAPGGTLVASGILRTEFDEVCRAYARDGLRLRAKRAEGEWCSGSFGPAVF